VRWYILLFAFSVQLACENVKMCVAINTREFSYLRTSFGSRAKNVKGGGSVKGKVLMLMLLVVFAAFTTFALVSSSIQINWKDVLANSWGSIGASGALAYPCGLPIDSPGGPT
jgi:hypothetical protein